METELISKTTKSPAEIRGGILDFEKKLSKVPGVKVGDACCPLKHHFGSGLYVRELLALKGHLIVTKIHKLTHPCFVMSGEVSVFTTEGVKRVKAPYWTMTPAGTQRICYVLSDSLWITVHPNPDDTEDLKVIEENVIAKGYDEVQLTEKELKKLKEA